MKITHLIFSLNIGGSETMLLDIINNQAREADVNLIIINNIYKDVLLKKIDTRVKVFFINRTPQTRNLFDLIRITTLLVKLKSDVLHCHNHNIIPLIIFPSHKRKAVLTLHTMDIPTKYLTEYQKLFAISSSVKKNTFSRSQIDSIIVYNGISTTEIQTREVHSIVGTFKIICTSRLEHPHKGQHLMIEALNLLKSNGVINLQLDLIGTGSSEQYLKNITSELELTDDVNFLGLRDRTYIYSHLKDYNLLVQPSLYEGFGLTVAEAMAAKIPVLVSDIDGPMEIIENGKYGYHFKVGSAEELAKQLHYIISIYNTNEHRDFIETAYKHVIENFNISSTVSKYLQYY